MYGENMKYYREEKGLSLKQVENLTGVNNGNLSRYERNLNFPSIEICDKLSTLYGVSIDELIGKNDSPKSKKTEKLSLSFEEEKLLNTFKNLSKSNKKKTLAFICGLI